MTNLLRSVYPSASFDKSYANYLTYLEFTNKHAAESKSLATELPKWVNSSSDLSVLDIGSGTGRLAHTVRDLYGDSRAFSMTLIEPAMSAVANIRANFSYDKRIQIHQTSFQSYLESSPTRRFNLVLASHVAYYFDDRAELLRAMISQVAPGGVLCCVAGSISLLQHHLYKELMQQIMNDPSINRSFGLDGYGACAEELELIGFNEGYIFDSIEIPGRMTFTSEQVSNGATALQSETTCLSNHFCISLGFLFRVHVSTIFLKRDLVLSYLMAHDAYSLGIDIPCSEKLLFLRCQ